MMRILFFHQGRISDWVGGILSGLSQQFRAAEILRFDLHHLIKQRPVLLATNLSAACVRYGGDLLRRKRSLDDAFFTTAYVFNQVKRLSLEIHRQHSADFSFQVGSMHDHSAPRVPHFVYTDFTYQSCREYPCYGQYQWSPTRSDRLIETERSIYDHACCTFTQSQAVASTLIESYGVAQNKVLNVCYGPNIPEHLLQKIPITEQRASSRQVLFVGGDWKRKGGPELAKAFEKVQRAYPDAQLVIVGCQPDVKRPFMRVVGRIPLEELPCHYAAAALFCMPSRLEPSAGVYVEAMHAGIPVVALRLGAVREIVTERHTGHLVEPGNLDGLADVIIERLANPAETVCMGKNARAIVSHNYTWSSVFNKVSARIHECLARSSESS